ncbi:MAG: 1-phosphofructokinase family hexose kinase [Clostridiales Family XIII bacterium]|jgi:1-phosphofructokinase|nr:1-phosphofructokinase family hexose kinase [Clostridiales Family XIII bacterium]
MIFTVTFNPALDYTLWAGGAEPGRIHHAEAASYTAGGKGVNVANVLTCLGVPCTALGFIAGFTGDEIARQARSWGIDTDFIRLPRGLSRVNVKVRTWRGEGGAVEETDFNAGGPDIDRGSMEKLYDKLSGIGQGDVLIVAGGAPASLSGGVYGELLGSVAGKGARCVVDAAGDLLRGALARAPFLIKPNVDELGELFGRKLRSDEEIRECAERLQDEGAVNVLVSKGGEGAALLTETGEFITVEAPSGRAVNTVGAGDSMVAGFVAGWIKRGDYRKALKWGTAAGAATAFSEGLATKGDILALLE